MHSIRYSLHISPDLLKATLRSDAADGETVRCETREELLQLLASKRITHGLDARALDQAVAWIDQRQPLAAPLVLARATPPIPGRHGMQPCHSPHVLTVEEIDENGRSSETEILCLPLVRPGQAVAEHRPPVPPVCGINIQGKEINCALAQEHTLHAGDLVTVNEPQQQIVAAAYGYPLVRKIRKGTAEQLVISIEPLIRITPDRMQALLCLHPAPPGHALPDQAEIVRILELEQISFGRLPMVIERCLKECARLLRPQQDVVALGTLPIKGKDAWLRFEMDVGPLPGKVMGNGEIDFRERNMFIGVGKDQLIAVRIPPTTGTPGRDVYGASVAQTPGKDIVIKVSDDAAYNHETGEIRASRAGVLSMVSEGTVKVCSRQIISQDIDYKTGNVVSRDALEIRGSIRPKFKVNALGDILIKGVIEKGQVRSDSNVVVQQGGLIGDHAVIRARGDVDVQFVEYGRIFSGGSIILRKSGYCCRLHSRGHLNCDAASRIIASQLVASGSITAGTVGSENSDPSLLAAAVAPEQLQLAFELRRTIAAQTEAIDALRRRMGPNADCDELEELMESLEESRKRYAHLNLIYPDDQMPADRGLSHAQECSITVKGKVYSGTEIRIGNSRMVLPLTMANVCFRLKEHAAGAGVPGQEILIIPRKK